jgi:hypothetical protein
MDKPEARLGRMSKDFAGPEIARPANGEGDCLPRWDADRVEFCSRIERIRSPIKILLKTKDDPFLVERWIKHHIKIVRGENLIIFDNMSDDPRVLSIYRKYRGEVDIIRFSDLHHNLHHTSAYGDLYRSLANSSEYFIFLDTDEYLVLFENDRYCDDDRILTFVTDNRDFDFFPATWLWNVNWSSVQFYCGVQPQDLAENLACGKPLIRSAKIPPGYVNHNFQLGTFAPPFKANLFLLHLARLYPRQRISTNVNKLIAQGFAQRGESPQSIADRSDITDEVAAGYVREIRDCLAAEGRQDIGNAPLSSGCLELLPDGTLSYYGEAERNAISKLAADPKAVYGLIADQYRLNATSVNPLESPADAPASEGALWQPADSNGGTWSELLCAKSAFYPGDAVYRTSRG